MKKIDKKNFKVGKKSYLILSYLIAVIGILGQIILPFEKSLGNNISSQDSLYNLYRAGYYTNSPVKTGDTLRMIAFGGSLVEWTGPNNFYSTSHFIDIDNADSTIAGTYHLTINDTIIDTIYDYYINITVEPLLVNPVIHLNLYDFTHVCALSEVNLWSDPGYSSYTWLVIPSPLAISSTTAQSVTAKFDVPASTPLEQTYTIKLTVTDAQSNSASSTMTVHVHDCCCTDCKTVLLLSGQTSTMLSTILASQPNTYKTLAVHNFLTVNDNSFLPADIHEVVLLNCQGSTTYYGSSIPYSSIFAGNSIFPQPVLSIGDPAQTVNVHGCKDMWASIQANLTSPAIKTINSTYRDGVDVFKFGITGYGPGSLNASNCHFSDNYNGISIIEAIPSLNLMFNTFNGTGQNLLGGYATKKAYTGMYIQASTITLNGYQNIFDNLGIGILGRYVNLNIKKNATIFSNIPGTSNYNAFDEGIGIKVEKWIYGGPNPSSLSKAGNSISGYPWDFQNCNTGISTQRCQTTITNNTMDNVSTGIRIMEQNLVGPNYSILGNEIYCNSIGIHLENLSPVNDLQVCQNKIYVGGVSSSNVGIYNTDVGGGNYTGSYMIGNNEIFLLYAKYGILQSDIHRTTILGNHVVIYYPNVNWAGINLSLSNDNLVQCNVVEGTNASIPNSLIPEYPFGLEFSSAKGNKIAWNNTKRLRTGMGFEEDCSASISFNTIFTCNEFRDHYIGLSVNPIGVVPPQNNALNSWTGSYGLLKAWDQSGSNPQWLELYGGDYCPQSLVSPLSWIPCNTNDGLPSMPPNPCSSPMMAYSQGTSISKYDSLVARNELNYAYYNHPITWQAQRTLLGKLESDSLIWSGNQVMQQFRDSAQNVSPGHFRNVELLGNAALKMDSTTSTNLKALQNQINLILNSISTIDSLLFTHPSYADSLLYSNQKAQLFTTYMTITHSLGSALQAYSSARNAQLDYVLEQNESLTADSIFETNEKIVNRILYGKIARGNYNLTQNEIDQIFQVASQCSVSGGASVYLARSIYSHFSDTVFNDKQLCLLVGIIKSKNIEPPDTKVITFSLFPNPASNEFSISWNNSINETAKFEITNILGQLVTSGSFNLQGASEIINTTNLESGVFYLSIFTETNLKYSAKVLISR